MSAPLLRPRRELSLHDEVASYRDKESFVLFIEWPVYDQSATRTPPLLSAICHTAKCHPRPTVQTCYAHPRPTSRSSRRLRFDALFPRPLLLIRAESTRKGRKTFLSPLSRKGAGNFKMTVRIPFPSVPSVGMRLRSSCFILIANRKLQ